MQGNHHTFLSTQEVILHFPSAHVLLNLREFSGESCSERSYKYATLCMEILCLGV